MENKYNILNIKEILLKGFTTSEIVNLIQISFQTHYDEEDYAGKNVMLLQKTEVIRKLVDFCQQQDKLTDLVEILKKERPKKVESFPIEIEEKYIDRKTNELRKPQKDLFNKYIREHINEDFNYTDLKNNYITITGDNNIIVQDVNGSFIEIAKPDEFDIIKEKTQNLNDDIKKLIYLFLGNNKEIFKIKDENLKELNKIVYPESKNQYIPDLIFTNRTNEFDEILTGKHISLFAPSGFGKTHLLRELKKRYEENKWKVFYAEFKDYTSSNTEKIEYEYVTLNSVEDLDKWLNKLNCTPNHVEQEAENKSPILFIVDDLEKLFDFENSIKKKFFEVLRQIHRIIERNEGVEYKFILSSRNEKIEVPSFLKNYYFKTVELTKFSVDNIKDVFIEKFKKSRNKFKQKEIDTIADVVYLYSGGHPFAITKLIDVILEKPYLEYEDITSESFFEKIHNESFKEIINKTVIELLPKEHRNPPDKKMLKLLKIVTVFRKFNASIINQLIDNNFLPDYNDFQEAIRDINSTNFYESSSMYKDAVARNILANSFLINEPQQFKIINNKAIDLLKDAIGFDNENFTKQKNATYQADLEFFVELIYHLIVKFKRTNELDYIGIREKFKNISEKLSLALTKKYEKSIIHNFKSTLISSIKIDKDIKSLLNEKELDDLELIIDENLKIDKDI